MFTVPGNAGKLICAHALGAGIRCVVFQVDANCRLRANDGMAPIHAAAQTGHLDCVAWLVRQPLCS